MILIFTRMYRAWRRKRGVGASGRAARGRADSPTATGAQSAAARGPFALLLHQARYDLLASVRNPRARFFTLIFPLLLLVIFAGVFGHGTTTVDGVTVHMARFFVPGIITMSIVTSGFAALVMTVAGARESGVLKRRRATPVPGAVLVGGQALATLATAAGMTVVLLVVARVGYGVAISAAGLASIALSVVLATLAFASLGYAVAGMVGNADAAQPVSQALIMPLYFISGVWVPTDQLPHALRTVAAAFPIEHLAAAVHLASVRSTLSSALAPADLAALALWALLGAALAARGFNWLPEASRA